METGSEGGIGGFFARAFAGEGGFQNTYTAEADGIIAFGSSFPGQILPVNIQPGQAAYSTMVRLPNGDVAILFEDASYHAGNGYALTFVTITKKQLQKAIKLNIPVF